MCSQLLTGAYISEKLLNENDDTPTKRIGYDFGNIPMELGGQ
jgi:hypothetical protein